MYENYHRYPDTSEWATKYHEDETGPVGWPSEANPLAPGDPTPPGYERRTGKELNDLRARIIASREHEHHNRRWNDRRLAELKAEAKRVLDEQRVAAEAVRSGAAHVHIDAATSAAELQHRIGNLHEAQSAKK